MNLDEILEQDNLYFKDLQQKAEPETIDTIEAYKAYYCIEHMPIASKVDAYMFCTAINLLNRYVKQKRTKNAISYSFKNRLIKVVQWIIAHPEAGIKVDLQKNRLLVIAFAPVQFSFHQVSMNVCQLLQTAKAQTPLVWDEIRKQNCALSVFQSGEKLYSLEHRTDKATFQAKLKKAMADYTSGRYVLGFFGPSTVEAEKARERRRKIKEAQLKEKRERTTLAKKWQELDVENTADKRKLEKLLNQFFQG